VEVQSRLLGVFNNGRFTPNLGNIQIPKACAIDVWFLVTLSPEGEDRLRPDLAMRFAKGYRLDVPPLRERSEDVVALAMQMAHVSKTGSPQEVFTEGALRLLEERASEMQVRELDATIRKLGDVTSKRPYSARDLESAHVAFAAGNKVRLAVASGKVTASHHDLSDVDDPVSDALAARTDSLAILAQWRKETRPLFALDARNPMALRGSGGDVLGGAAAAVLAYLEICVQVTASSGYSSARTWNFFAGTKGTKSPDARTRIAPLFLIDNQASLAALRRSDPLLWLAVDVAGRRSEVVKLVETLESDPAQAMRVSEARARRAGAK
jgi:hypothetical protein